MRSEPRIFRGSLFRILSREGYLYFLREFWSFGEIQNFFHKLRIPYFFFVLFLLVSLFAFINMIVYE